MIKKTGWAGILQSVGSRVFRYLQKLCVSDNQELLVGNLLHAIKKLESRKWSSGRAKFDRLYDLLNILDTKASNLLQILVFVLGLLAAGVSADVIELGFSFKLPFFLVSFVALVLSILLCSCIVGLKWGLLGLGGDEDKAFALPAKIDELAGLVVTRTKLLGCARCLAFLGSFAFLFLFLMSAI